MAWRHVNGLALLLAMAAGCAPPPAEPPEIPEPASALRPEPLRGAVPADARIADYTLDARLDADEHTIDGTAIVTWRNATARTVTTLPFHLYMNAFRAEDTAWMRTSRDRRADGAADQEGTWGSIDVHSVRWLEKDVAPGPVAPEGRLRNVAPEARQRKYVIEEPVELPGGESLVELEWREDSDPSTMTVSLPGPVGPGETITIELEFTTRLPRVAARTGYFEDFHAVAQWYPKIGVLEEEGWQAHTFTYYDEFYADFGNYRATLDVPESMIVGATGIRTGEDVEAGRKRLTYAAEMVHDFAWFADPSFVEHHGEHRGVRVRQLIQPEHVGDAAEHMAAVAAAFESYEERFGPYPWSTLTIVHPPAGAEAAAGMEYPTLFTTDDRAQIPDWVRASLFDERLSGLDTTVHELGHQYFQGLFAVREHLEPWLDEGMNTFSNMMAAEDRLGDNPWMARVLDRKLYLNDVTRLWLSQRGFWGPVDRPASAFDGAIGNYSATVYTQAAAAMSTLRDLAGIEAFDRAMALFARQARFRHPRGADLEALLVRELGERLDLAEPGGEPAVLDVQEFLDQALRTNREVDFTVVAVSHRRLMKAAGWRRGPNGRLEGGEPPANLDTALGDLPDEEVEGVVVVRRAGGFVVPVELRVDFADGGVLTRVWDGRETTAVFTFPGRRVDLATLDPDDKLLLEWRRLDNAAFASDLAEDDGLSSPVADFAEALSLAILGSLGP